MKNTVLIFLFSILTISGCNSQQNVKFTGKESVLDFYRHYSSFTDPGEYACLYKNLPDSLTELCRLIKSQFIHPFAELPKFRDQIPEERGDESINYPTVELILEGLLSYDSKGIIKDRKPKDRLILGCRENALLLASVLKYRGIPVRLRAGHATYIIPDFHTSHTICEVWNEKDKRWMLVDPGMDKVDFNKDEFDISNNAWIQLQNNETDPNLYGIPGQYPGFVSIVAKVCSDMAFLLGNEYPIYQYAPILDYAFKSNNQLTAKHIETLNRISELMKSLDKNNLLKLQDIYDNTPDFQLTKTFDLNKKNTGTKGSLINKPDIEFAVVPGGTFIMGSHVSEQGRQDDETQHEVTVSDFKMSKYCITYEQYDMFCEATGRKRPWGKIRENMPVSQVTWYDAQAFAEWMGCRLPTEAEFEYAARAGTTTPFYTGNCLTTAQANFNGSEPYTNCEKGTFRKEAMPVGSFPPNAFGLYDMHGNIWEWTNDWYGEYNVNDTINPKGPETGERKVDRGGGFYDTAWRCRSACRGGGTHPGNKGTGISFRIVVRNLRKDAANGYNYEYENSDSSF